MDSSAASQMSSVFVDLPALAQILQRVPLHQRLDLEAELHQVSTPVELPTMTIAPKQEVPKPEVPKPEVPKPAPFTPLSAPFIIPSTNQKVAVPSNPASGSDSQVSSSAAEPALDDDGDEELDQLLGLQKPVSGVSGNQLVSVAAEQRAVPENGNQLVSVAAEQRAVPENGNQLVSVAAEQRAVPENGNQLVSVAAEQRAVPENAGKKAKDVVPEVIEKKMETKDKVITTPKSASVRQEMTEENLENWLDSMIS